MTAVSLALELLLVNPVTRRPPSAMVSTRPQDVQSREVCGDRVIVLREGVCCVCFCEGTCSRSTKVGDILHQPTPRKMKCEKSVANSYRTSSTETSPAPLPMLAFFYGGYLAFGIYPRHPPVLATAPAEGSGRRTTCVPHPCSLSSATCVRGEGARGGQRVLRASAPGPLKINVPQISKSGRCGRHGDSRG